MHFLGDFGKMNCFHRSIPRLFHTLSVFFSFFFLSWGELNFEKTKKCMKKSRDRPMKNNSFFQNRLKNAFLKEKITKKPKYGIPAPNN